MVGFGKKKSHNQEATSEEILKQDQELAGYEDGVPADVSADEVMRKYDKESNTRIWEGIPKYVTIAILVAFSVYCMLMTLLSTEQAEARLARFVGLVIVIGYMMYPANKKHHRVNHMPWYDIILVVHLCTTPLTVPTFS